jgi:glyoxylase-like metal-dependent hydrolase (beta-lactamase superfamily II)
LKQYIKQIISQGDDNGNEMVVKFQLPSGLDIFSFPTKNFYAGHWDLGPTWNYAVMADNPFLVDSGRFGQGEKLADMMAVAGVSAKDLEFVLISHGHEDHDGGLAELVKSTRLKVKAHKIYELLIRKYPDLAPPDHKMDFPAKCWHCPMPASFYTKNCLGYHLVLEELAVDAIADGQTGLGPDVQTYHLPGHSPDCLALLLGTEAIIVGDIVLPDISPWPTREAMYEEVAKVIQPDYHDSEAFFGLQRYIKSLKKLGEIAEQYPEIIVFPAHRLFYDGQWNGVRLAERVDELIQHHVERCGAVLDILNGGAKTADEIAREHFEESLLEGFGSMMAANEIVSHCELLSECGDVVAVDMDKYAASGSTGFERHIQALRSEY